MARMKNATFTGSGFNDLDVAAPTFKRLVQNAVGDTALVFDLETGHNESPIVHDGNLGALLGVPIINAWIGASLILTAPTVKGSSAGLGETWIYAVPFHLPAGETELRVELSAFLPLGDDVLTPFVEIRGTTNTVITRKALTNGSSELAGDQHALYTARLTGLSSGWNLLFIGVDTTNIDPNGDTAIGKLFYIRARPRLNLGSSIGSFYEVGHAASARTNTNGENPAGVTVPAATEGVSHRDFEATLFANLEPIDGYVLAGLNRNLNGLLEYITGWPAGGNVSYTHEDQDGAGAPDATDPARSRFEAHTQAIYNGGIGLGTEGEVDFPVWCEGFGAFLSAGLFAVELAEPTPTKGMLGWYAPWPRTIAEQTVRSAFVNMPDFPTGTSRLTCCVLLGSENVGAADAAQWTIKCKTTTGNATATPVHVDAVGDTLWLATINAVPFTGDANELVEITMARSAAKPAGTAGIGEVCVLGVGLAFVRP